MLRYNRLCNTIRLLESDSLELAAAAGFFRLRTVR